MSASGHRRSGQAPTPPTMVLGNHRVRRATINNAKMAHSMIVLKWWIIGNVMTHNTAAAMARTSGFAVARPAATVAARHHRISGSARLSYENPALKKSQDGLS